MKRFLLFLPLLVALVVGVVLFAGIGKDPTKLESALVGKQVPEFSLRDLHNPDAMLDQSLFRGQVSLLNVWGTWCPACKDEHDDLMWLAEEKGVNIIGLNYKDDPDDARRWLAQFGNPYSHSMVDRDGRMGIHWGVYGVPETFVVDSQGVVRHKHIGPLSLQDLTEDILPLVKQLREGG